MGRYLRLIAVAGLLLGTTGCARALDVGSEPRPVYRLLVINEFNESMIVSYNDGRGDSMLGAVPAGRSDSFVVAQPASPSVTVSARNSAGTRTAGPFPVELRQGDSVTVRIR